MNAKVLVVEDNQDNMKLITWVLEEEQYQVTGVFSAEDAFELIGDNCFDIILMDIDLPGMNGEEATRKLRKDTRFENLPIVALTAHALKEEVESIMSAGFTWLATKPIDEQMVLGIIKKLLTRGE